MKASDFITALKEFTWDIVGFLIPGVLLIFFITIFISIPISMDLPYEDGITTLIFFFVAYALGHVLHGVNGYLDSLLKIRNKVVSEIEKSETYKKAKSFVIEELNNYGNTVDESNLKLNEVRNFAMSRFPSIDNKVYTFMFRSIIASHLISLFSIFGILGLVSWTVYMVWGLAFFKIETVFLVCYILMLLCLFPLIRTKKDFYSIAMRLPMSVLISTHKNQKDD